MPTLQSARGRAAALAALITVAAVCAGDAVARSFPFGPHTRSVNDLGNQFVPFHAHLWDLLHGRADGGLLLELAVRLRHQLPARPRHLSDQPVRAARRALPAGPRSTSRCTWSRC